MEIIEASGVYDDVNVIKRGTICQSVKKNKD